MPVLLAIIKHHFLASLDVLRCVRHEYVTFVDEDEHVHSPAKNTILPSPFIVVTTYVSADQSNQNPPSPRTVRLNIGTRRMIEIASVVTRPQRIRVVLQGVVQLERIVVLAELEQHACGGMSRFLAEIDAEMGEHVRVVVSFLRVEYLAEVV